MLGTYIFFALLRLLFMPSLLLPSVLLRCRLSIRNSPWPVQVHCSNGLQRYAWSALMDYQLTQINLKWMAIEMVVCVYVVDVFVCWRRAFIAYFCYSYCSDFNMLQPCRLGHSNVFDLIHQHDLFASVSDRIVMLMEFDSSAAVKMLLDNTDKIPVRHQWAVSVHWAQCVFERRCHNIATMFISLFLNPNRFELPVYFCACK